VNHIILNLQGHSWEVTAEIGMNELYNEAVMDQKTATFDVNSGRATFNNLLFLTSGVFVVKFNVTSDPNDYSLEHQETVVVRATNQEQIIIDVAKEIQVKFEDDYNQVIGQTSNKYFESMVLHWFIKAFDYVIPTPEQVSKGNCLIFKARVYVD
jgi:hypothetical protein